MGVLLLAETGGEEDSDSSAVIFNGRAARGDTFLGTSGDPFLPQKHKIWHLNQYHTPKLQPNESENEKKKFLQIETYH